MHKKLSLSELNDQIRNSILEAFPETVWVVAEISELKENRSGHCYLELIEKDPEGEEIKARIKATIWSYSYRMLKPYFETTTGQLFTSGIKVLVQVTIEFHPAFGLSLNIRDIDPIYTIGDLVRQRNEILKKLKEEGVFDMNRSLPLPEVPQKIAVISSATAAGYQDFIDQLEKNQYGFRFYPKLFEAFMQGAEATQSIIHALERIYRYEDWFDLVVIIRGGGAQADLSCFDHYDLAINITQFPLPVLTGIGHEKDDTVIDMVAHTRLKTPTAVAEFLVSGVLRFYEKLLDLESVIVDLVRKKLEEEEHFLIGTSEDFLNSAKDFLNQKQQMLASTAHNLEMDVHDFSYRNRLHLKNSERKLSVGLQVFINRAENNLIHYIRAIKTRSEFLILARQNTLDHLKEFVKNASRNKIHDGFREIDYMEKSTDLLNPEGVLKRGYTLSLQDGTIIKSSRGLDNDKPLTTRFADGEVKSKIINSKKWQQKK